MMRQNRVFYVLHSAVYKSDGTLSHLNVLEFVLDCDTSRGSDYDSDIKKHGVAFLGKHASSLTLYNVVQRQMIMLPFNGITKGSKESTLCKYLFGSDTKISDRYTRSASFYNENSVYMSYVSADGLQLNEKHAGIFLIGFDYALGEAENTLRDTLQRSYVMNAQGDITSLCKCQHPWLRCITNELTKPTSENLLSYMAYGLTQLPGAKTPLSLGDLPLYLDTACAAVEKQRALHNLSGVQGKYEHWYSQRVYSDVDKTGLALTYDLINAAAVPSEAEQVSIYKSLAAPLQLPPSVLSAKISVEVMDKPVVLPKEMCYIHIYVTTLYVPLCQMPEIVQPPRLSKATPYLSITVEKAVNTAYTKTISIPTSEVLEIMQIRLDTQICENLIVPVVECGSTRVTVDKPSFNLSCLPRKKRNTASNKANIYGLRLIEGTTPPKVGLDVSADKLAIVTMEGVLSKPTSVLAKLGKYCVYTPNFCCNEVLVVKDKGDLNLSLETGKAAYDTTMHIRGNLHSLCITYTRHYIREPFNKNKKHIYIEGDLDYITFSVSCFNNIVVHVKQGFIKDMMARYNIAERPYSYGNSARTIRDSSGVRTYALHPAGVVSELREAIANGLLVEDL